MLFLQCPAYRFFKAIVRNDSRSWFPQCKIITDVLEIGRERLNFLLLLRQSGFQFANSCFLRFVFVRFLSQRLVRFRNSFSNIAFTAS